MRTLFVLLAVGLGVPLGLVVIAAAGGAALAGLGSVGPSAGPPGGEASPGVPSGLALDTVPPAFLVLYRRAAAICPGLGWTLLAAIGTVESDNGRSDAPGVHSGANSAGAEGPMQFEPATFAAYDLPVPPGGVSPPDVYDPTDAVYAAARMLCADGAGTPAGVAGAVFAYNHAGWYVSEVLALAASYGRGGSP